MMYGCLIFCTISYLLVNLQRDRASYVFSLRSPCKVLPSKEPLALGKDIRSSNSFSLKYTLDK
eukprot:c31494_g1_i1 orf=152-340(-)